MRIMLLAILCLTLSSQCSQNELAFENEESDPENLIPQKRFYRSGELLANYTITPDSLLYGLYEEYYLDGTVHRRINYRNGRINGSYESFHPSGNIASRHTYVDGYAHGPYFWYHKNGTLAQKGKKIWEKAEGIVEVYFPNGQLQARHNYRNERLIGSDITYLQDGSLEQFAYYDQDADRIFTINYRKDGSIWQVSGNPFSDLSAEINRFSGQFLLDFNLALPPQVKPEIRLLRRQEGQTWLCPIASDDLHFKYREPLPDDFEGKYQLQVVFPMQTDSLRFEEAIFVQHNSVSFGAPF